MLIAFSAWIILTAVMCWDYANDNFQIGHPASRDVKAIYDFTYIDEDATEKEKLKAAGAVDKVIVPDKTVTNSVTHSVELTFSKIAACRDRHRNSILKMSAAVDKPETAFPVFISADMFENILSLSDSSFELVRNTSKIVTRNIMNEGVDASDVNDKLVSSHDIDRIKDVVSHLELNEIEKMIVISVASSAVRPNKKLDWQATKDLQADKMSKIEPVSKFIPKGQIIIREGEIVTPIQLDIIKSMGGVSLSQAGLIKKIAAGGIGALVMLLLVYFGVKKYSPQVLSERRLMLLLAIIMTVSAIVFKAIAVVSDGDFNELCFYIMPVAASAVLIEMIAGSSVAFICTVILSTFVAVVSKNASASFTSLFTGIIALMAFSGLRNRNEMLLASFVLISANIVSAWILNSFTPGSDAFIFGFIIASAANGTISCFLIVGGMFFIENLFPVVTNLTLLELANPEMPLLKDLVSKAPGTHVHSILVANLAEAGASAVGADPLLARVGAYYHDIGKTRQPSMFIENQFGALNPHDRVSTTLSKVIITAHVKQGVELARKHRLPEPIIAIIAQHHGTSLLRYFHSKALKANKNTREEDFRYPGPKPQTKEAAVIMMADSIEAAVRSLKAPDGGKIESMINIIINNMLNDGQFNDCDLSFKDIAKLKRVFLKSMTSLYHTRIEYPDQKKNFK